MEWERVSLCLKDSISDRILCGSSNKFQKIYRDDTHIWTISDVKTLLDPYWDVCKSCKIILLLG